MPIYEHLCEKCNKTSTHLYSFSEDPGLIKCPECGSDTKRLMCAPHLGWERKILNTFVKGEDERAEAQQNDPMGPNPYQSLPGEGENQ